MTYQRHFNYEVKWSGEYYEFRYLQDARKFLKRKSGYIIMKCWYYNNEFVGYTFVEESIA